MRLTLTRLLLLCLLSLSPLSLLSQTTTVEGTIREMGTEEVLPYAHVFFKGTGVGTTSDTAGHFLLKINTKDLKEDSLIVSFMGYESSRRAIQRNKKQTINIELNPQFMQLGEFFVRPGENAAWPILRQVIANKEQNNPDNLPNYYSQEYSKIRFDLNHFTEKIKKNILLRPFDYIWENVDTSDDGITYLPVLIVEKDVEHYYRRTPRDQKDYINGVNTTGLAGPKIMKFVEDLYQAPNFYNNFVVILDKNFVSPINDNYKNNYKYYLNDSTGDGAGKSYRISFRPKNKRDLVFTGEMIIDSVSWAIREMTVRFDISSNVNFVRSFWINQKYAPVNGKNWMITESNVLGDFTVIENSSDLTGFFGRKNSSFANYSIDSVIPKKIFQRLENVIESDSARLRNDKYWEDARRLAITKQDENVFKMSARVEKDPKFLLRKNIIVGIATGYFPINDRIDIGNIYSFYSYNAIERSRVKLGAAWNPTKSFPLSANAYLAYGTYDKQWKYLLAAEYGFSKQTKQLGFSLRYDITQLTRSPNNLQPDHLFSSFIQLGGIDASRNYEKDLDIYFENSWATGIVIRLNYFNRTFTPTAGIQYNMYDGGGHIVQKSDHQAAGMDLTFRFSWQNKGVRGRFYDLEGVKNSFRKYPDLTVQYIYADKRLFGSDFDYSKLRFALRQQIRTGKLGYFKYYLEAGKTFGTVPYQFLDLPFANQLVAFDEYAFNLMNFLEYATDQYATVHLEQHMEGLILDRIPLVNKLKWRNFFFAKGYFGSLRDENYSATYLFPKKLSKLRDPYYEVGFGIENIFKFARMDFVWRVTDVEKPDVYYFIVKPSFRFAF